MKNLKQELLVFCEENINLETEEDSEFYGRYFLDDNMLDYFAKENNLSDEDGDFNSEKIENECDCQLVYDYSGSNPNRQVGDQEIIFN